MKSDYSEHLSSGALVAFAQSKSVLNKNRKAQQHLANCPSCSDTYKSFTAVKKSIHQPEFRDLVETLTDCKCPETEVKLEKNASVFFAFITKEISEESASRLLSHLNSCYLCFEYFTVTWSDYLMLNS
jgi:C4-type Zn-finger protein